MAKVTEICSFPRCFETPKRIYISILFYSEDLRALSLKYLMKQMNNGRGISPVIGTSELVYRFASQFSKRL